MDSQRYRAICLKCQYKSGWYYMERSAQDAGDAHQSHNNHRFEIEVQDKGESK